MKFTPWKVGTIFTKEQLLEEIEDGNIEFPCIAIFGEPTQENENAAGEIAKNLFKN